MSLPRSPAAMAIAANSVGRGRRWIRFAQTLKDGLKTVAIDGEQLYVSEEDILLDEDQLMVYALDRQEREEAQRAGAIWTGRHHAGGRIVRWRPGLVLSYRMAGAARAWEETCGVDFEHRTDLDTASGVAPSGVLMAVREFDSGGAFIAAAFFPNDRSRRSTGKDRGRCTAYHWTATSWWTPDQLGRVHVRARALGFQANDD